MSETVLENKTTTSIVKSSTIDLSALLNKQKEAFLHNPSPSIEKRRNWLQQLRQASAETSGRSCQSHRCGFWRTIPQ